MKLHICVSVDEKTILKINEKLRDGFFRNKSHLVEHAVNAFLEEGEQHG
ncbi:hypothetical protein JXA85_07490 [Candidatus Woesearchaeota archaeon]|nr:hypothetical protein [Candidatus Woesearchaeota archaeon]